MGFESDSERLEAVYSKLHDSTSISPADLGTSISSEQELS